MASTFRTAFQIERTFNWFPGHMARGLRDMTAKLQTVDLIIETRDARLPLSSINPQFEEFAQERNRLIVYNKTDLTTPGTPARIRQALAGVTNAPVVFTNAKTPRTVRSVVSYAAGMPNVGKSALINALRSAGVGRGNAVTTGRRPGVTQRIHTSVKIHANPPVYVLDTPGLMLPYVSDPLRALKVALTDGMNTEAMEIEIVADYLLYQLNRQHNTE
ncbi:Mitochondrial GTPase 1 [Tieghemiomyces parasiticus]|uniref:Mitochondrial GTPase 1 n=1 Tax=Tieghemiomyces parasiticus TaxID=78921 RepID=A0A9W8AA58_9FUNG|nr:Mitochondrial GTPase 1 [Tieghemiomyces parasiticus]